MNWDDLKVFLAVSEGRSLSAAALHLGVSASTVSRRIDVLEQQLGLRLFYPSQRGYELTASGQNLLATAEAAAAQMRVFERQARGADSVLAGPIRIEAPELYGQEVLLPVLSDFIAAYPAIEIALQTTVRPLHLAREQADIVLRITRPTEGQYQLRRVGQIRFGLYAAPAYVARFGAPQVRQDLPQHRIIGWCEDLQFLSMAIWLESLCPGLVPVLRLSSFNAQLVAAKQGLGWAVLPDFAARAAGLSAGLLAEPRLEPELWMLLHQQTASLPRVALLQKYLLQNLRDSGGRRA